MNKRLPTISVIIPTFNEENNLKTLFPSLVSQEYPRNNIEYIVVDDFSTDKTREIARKFGAKVIDNGTHDIEWGKSLGLKASRGDFVFYIDADNKLMTKRWFSVAIKIFQDNKDLIGLQSYKFQYVSDHNLVNRYCELFGINDPLAYYLGKRGLLKAIENNWIYPDTLIKNNKKYFKVKFDLNNIPPYGSQGYMIRRSSLLETDWQPYLFHMDSTADLVRKGKNIFGFIKYGIEHNYANNFIHLIKKLKRNICLYLKHKNKRRYKYNMTPFRLFVAVVIMVTIIIPLTESVYGYSKKRDIAWFLHPVVSFVVVFVYLHSLVLYGLKKWLTLR